jgi:hypothetical protein
VAANGVESSRQWQSPRNAVQVPRILLRHGADPDAVCNAYGGGLTPLCALVSSAHPAHAGVQGGLAGELYRGGANPNGLDEDGLPLWMGGTVATLFAERHSSRLAGLILVDSPPPDGSGTWDPGPRPDGDLPYDWAVKPAIFAQLSHPDPAWWAELPAITAPALVIGGGSTSPVPQDLLAKAAELIPGATLVTIEGAGHVVHQTRPCGVPKRGVGC